MVEEYDCHDRRNQVAQRGIDGGDESPYFDSDATRVSVRVSRPYS